MPDIYTITRIPDEDHETVRQLLLGRRIVAVEQGQFTIGDDDRDHYWSADTTGRLTLDDGTQIYVTPHIGCSCGAGDYELTALATVDNVITGVRLAAEEENVDGEGPTSYRIYVVADAQEINAVQIDGYYGTGYALTVVPAATEPVAPESGSRTQAMRDLVQRVEDHAPEPMRLIMGQNPELPGTMMTMLNRQALIDDLVAFWHHRPTTLLDEAAERWLVEHGVTGPCEEEADAHD